jgi:hypothetical protein
MDVRVVYAKTPKGVKEMVTRPGELARPLRATLSLVDGQSTFRDILAKSGGLEEADVQQALSDLCDQGYVKAIVRAGDDDPFPSPEDDPEARARQQAEWLTLYMTEEAAHIEAEAREEQAASLRAAEAEKQAREQAAQAARQAAEREAAEQARRQAQEEAERREKERTRAEAGRKAHEVAERRAKELAERQAREAAERQAKDAAERQETGERKEAEQPAETPLAQTAERKAGEESESAATTAAQPAALTPEQQAQEEVERWLIEDAKQRAEEEAAREAKENAERETTKPGKRPARAATEKPQPQARQIDRHQTERKAREEMRRRAKQEDLWVAHAEARRLAQVEAARRAHQDIRGAGTPEQKGTASAEPQSLAQAETARKAGEGAQQANEEARRAAALVNEQAIREDSQRQAREHVALSQAELGERQEVEQRARVEYEQAAREQAERVAQQRAARKAAEQRAREEEAERAGVQAQRIEQEISQRLAELETERRAQETLRRRSSVEDMQWHAEAARAAFVEPTLSRPKTDEEMERLAQPEEIDQARTPPPPGEKPRTPLRGDFNAQAEAYAHALREGPFARAEPDLYAHPPPEGDKAPQDHRWRDADPHVREKLEALAREQAGPKTRTKKNRLAKRAGPRKGGSRWLKFLGLGLFLLLALGVTLIQFVPLPFYKKTFEDLASERLGEPVAIGTIRVALFPRLSFTLSNVRIGVAQDIQAKSVKVFPLADSLIEPQKILRHVAVRELSASAQALPRMLAWTRTMPPEGALQVHAVALEQATLTGTDIGWPPFDAEAAFKIDGTLYSATVSAQNGAVILRASPQGEYVTVSVHARDWQPPVGMPVKIDELRAKGMAIGNKIDFSELSFRFHGGRATGNLLASWGEDWRAQGQLTVSGVSMEKFGKAPSVESMIAGQLDTSLEYSMQAPTLGSIADTPSIEATFNVKNGYVKGIDLNEALLSSTREEIHGGATRFEGLSGAVSVADSRCRFRQLSLRAGQLSAGGYADVGLNRAVRGRVDATLQRPDGKALEGFFFVVNDGSGISLRAGPPQESRAPTLRGKGKRTDPAAPAEKSTPSDNASLAGSAIASGKP